MEQESESLPAGIFALPGEPAIVINGVPDLPSSNDTVVPDESSKDGTPILNNNMKNSNFAGHAGFGVWLEGRAVRKLFDNEYYSGTVINFDKESGWYRVAYEDGDFEDLNWQELQGVLLPLDITVPVKSLALKIGKNNQKHMYKPGKSSRGKKVATHEKISSEK